MMETTLQSTRRGLTPAEAKTYREDGLVIPDFRLPDSLLARLREALDRVLAMNPDISPDRLTNAHIPYQESTRLGVRGGGGPFFEVATLPEILDMVQDCLGPDIILWGTALFAKPGGTGKEIPWHQDGHFYCISPLESCSVWIALDDVDTENACMRYIPGSHKLGLVEHLKEDREDVGTSSSVNAALFDEGAAKDDVLPAGRFSIHDVNLIHGSRANRSSRRRAGLAIRYMPASSHYDHHHVFTAKPKVNPDTLNMNLRPLWVVRGANQNPSNDFSIGHDGLADLDARVAAANRVSRRA